MFVTPFAFYAVDQVGAIACDIEFCNLSGIVWAFNASTLVNHVVVFAFGFGALIFICWVIVLSVGAWLISRPLYTVQALTRWSLMFLGRLYPVMSLLRYIDFVVFDFANISQFFEIGKAIRARSECVDEEDFVSIFSVCVFGLFHLRVD